MSLDRIRPAEGLKTVVRRMGWVAMTEEAQRDVC
jgi:hypothetical protein